MTKLDLSLVSQGSAISVIPYRDCRVGHLPHTILFACCLGITAGILLLVGAITTGIVYTEVRPPTADDNYERYRGADFRRVFGPLMIAMALFTLAVGFILVFGGFFSAAKDYDQQVIRESQSKQEMVGVQQQLLHHSGGPGRV